MASSSGIDELEKKRRVATEMSKAKKALQRWDFKGAIMHTDEVLKLDGSFTDAQKLQDKARIRAKILRIALVIATLIIVAWFLFMTVVDWGPDLLGRVKAVYGPTLTPTLTYTFTPTSTSTSTPTSTFTPTPTSTPTVTQTPTPTPIFVILRGNVRVFSAPDSESTLVGYLENGTTIQVLAIYGDWAWVIAGFGTGGAKKGWVALEYARPAVIPAAIVTPTAVPTSTAVVTPAATP